MKRLLFSAGVLIAVLTGVVGVPTDANADDSDCSVANNFVGATKYWVFFKPQGASADINVRDVPLSCDGEYTFGNAWAMVSDDCWGCYIQSGFDVSNDDQNGMRMPIAFSQWGGTSGRTVFGPYVGGSHTFFVEKVGTEWFAKVGATTLDRIPEESLWFTPSQVEYLSESNRPAQPFPGSDSLPVQFRKVRYKEANGTWTTPDNSSLGWNSTLSHGHYQTTTDGFDTWDDRN